MLPDKLLTILPRIGDCGRSLLLRGHWIFNMVKLALLSELVLQSTGTLVLFGAIPEDQSYAAKAVLNSQVGVPD